MSSVRTSRNNRRLGITPKQGFVSRPPRQKNKQTPPTSKFKGLTSSQIRKLQKEN